MAINILAYRKDVAPNSKACLPFTYAKRRSGGPSLLKSAKKSRWSFSSDETQLKVY